VERPGVTATIAEFAVGAPKDVATDAALDMAERSVVDTIGVALAAKDEETMVALARAQVGRLPPGPCSVLAVESPLVGQRTQPVQAAFLNGTAAHALDYDDVADSIKGHPSAVLVPAVLAVAEELGRSGSAVLETLCLGFQIECALADGLGIESYYSRGWHSTATIGVIAAAACASRLLGSDVLTTRRAAGIAGSMAAGSRQNFGTMTKPLHAGLAASNGVLAAYLAASGFTADPDQLEAPLGYLSLYGQQPFDAGRFTATLGGESAIVSRGLNIKRYPSCYDTSRTADAALAVAAVVDPGDISEVRVTVEPGGLRPLIHHRPQTGLEGKFSLEFVAAASLLDRKLSLASFTDDSVRRPAVQALMSRVVISEDAVPPLGGVAWRQSYSVVRVSDHGGLVTERRMDAPLGHAERPLSESELADKFAECLEHVGRGTEARLLFERLRRLRSCPDLADIDLARFARGPALGVA
jgi:2-methylcitrate dehydratase PrpD